MSVFFFVGVIGRGFGADHLACLNFFLLGKDFSSFVQHFHLLMIYFATSTKKKKRLMAWLGRGGLDLLCVCFFFFLFFFVGVIGRAIGADHLVCFNFFLLGKDFSSFI